MSQVERLIFLDTETTGLSAHGGDRIIELGCVEVVNRSLTGHNLHLYFNPDRDSSPEALKVHGLTTEFLSDKPRFSDELTKICDYLRGAKVYIHNAPFDMGFLDVEFQRAGLDTTLLELTSSVEDTLTLAREMYPGKRNNLDALCERLEVPNEDRVLHGALLDSKLLASVWLKMTRGQFELLSADAQQKQGEQSNFVAHDFSDISFAKVQVSQADEQAHLDYLRQLEEVNKTPAQWVKYQQKTS
ncbi:MAG: DNA polymerase III subunit epsilon [Alcaligenaceae bacterium]|nr:DNA polymerase III subunit epsilon [Alcaligenaceae bacterium]